MATLTPITPTYASGDLARILEIEEQQIEDTVADLTEEQMRWQPTPKAKSALDILWHIAFDYEEPRTRPSGKAEALAGLRAAYEKLQHEIAEPGRLEEPMSWWTGDTFPFRGFVWGAIRHRTFHLGELVYLRQVMGVDEPKYHHEGYANGLPEEHE